MLPAFRYGEPDLTKLDWQAPSKPSMQKPDLFAEQEDDINRLTNETLFESDKITDAWLHQIKQDIQVAQSEGLSLAEFQERLIGYYGKIDVEHLSHLLGDSEVVADLTGRENANADVAK